MKYPDPSISHAPAPSAVREAVAHAAPVRTAWPTMRKWLLRRVMPLWVCIFAFAIATLLWHRHGTQIVTPGEVEPNGTSIITYIRREHRIRPTVTMSVIIRPCTNPKRRFESSVVSVDGQVQPIPGHLATDPKTPQWGLPVRIALPPNSALLPGDQVDVAFRLTSE